MRGRNQRRKTQGHEVRTGKDAVIAFEPWSLWGGRHTFHAIKPRLPRKDLGSKRRRQGPSAAKRWSGDLVISGSQI